MKNIDSFTHVRGESLFVDDLITRQDTLHGVVFDAPKAHGKITSVDYSKAAGLPGVVKIFTHKDIRGENQIGGIIPDEPFYGRKMKYIFGDNPLPLLSQNQKPSQKRQGS